jgi:aldehyde dehydrogenase (NAD+)
MSSATEELADLLPVGSIIGGELIDSSSGGVFEHHNPATGAVQRLVPLAGSHEVQLAVESARSAASAWRRFSPDSRRDVLLRIAILLREGAEETAKVITLENGTPSMMASALSGNYPADWFSYYSGWPERVGGDVIPVSGANGLDYTISEPYGVIAAIIPWNAPLASVAMKVAPALAAGNCVVIKPPELAPFTTLRFAQLCLDAGVPPGVVNVVVGGPEAGDLLVRHPQVDKISFTGGLETAKKIMAAAAENVTPLTLELGGKSANIVFEDAAIEVAIPTAIMMSVAALSGQGCALPTRLLLQDSIYDACVERLVAMTGMVSVGDPLDPSTVMGPVVSAAHCARIEGVIARAKADGAGKLLAGGNRLGGSLAKGYFLEPTVFGDVDNTSHLAQEEIFGPVLCVLRFRDEEEAIALSNGTKYGGYLWTNNLARAHRVASRLEAGWINVNAAPLISPSTPFGGYGQSGYGREGGHAGLSEYLRTKNVFINLN